MSILNIEEFKRAHKICDNVIEKLDNENIPEGMGLLALLIVALHTTHDGAKERQDAERLINIANGIAAESVWDDDLAANLN